MNPSALTPEQLEQMLSLAATRLGTPTDKLKETFEKEGLKGLSAALPPQAQQLLGDRDKMTALLEDPAVRKLLNQLLD